MVFDEYLEFYQHSICPSEKHCQAFLNQIGFKKSYFTTGFKKIHTKSEIYSKRKIRTKKTWYCLLVFLVCTVDFCSGKGRDILNERSPLLQTQGYLNAKIFQGSGSKNVRDLDVESLDVENFDDFYFRDFKYLKKWGNDTDVLLVLGRNNVYMIDPYASTPIVYFKERLHSVPTNSERAQCLRSIREEVYCHNYILNAHLLNNTKLKVCGTNSISPKCRYYTREQFNQTNPTENSYYSAEEPCNACPSTSKRNSLLLKVDNGSSTSTMYGAFYAYSYLGNNPLLVRANNFLKTQADCFTDPNFLKMLDYKEKVYLFFTETTTNMEAEKPSHQEIHSQVAQVCKNDNYDNKWRTFLKARLYCNVKQDKGFRFEYNILTAVSEVISVVLKPGQEPTDVIFATFTTPREWEEMGLLSSAVCMYSMSDSIISLFENKDFLSIEYKEGDNSVFWAKPIPAPDQNLGRLGRCVYRNESLQAYIDFASTNFRMYDAVTPLYDGAIYVTESNIRTSQILIDSNAGDMNELMIFLGTESGNVLRVKPRKNKKALLMEEIQLVDKADESDSGINSVKKLFIPRRKQSQKVHLLVGFTNRVLFVPLASCSQHYNETICQGDPECGFDGRSCVERTFENRERLGLVQSLTNVLVAETKRGKNTTAIGDMPSTEAYSAGVSLILVATVAAFFGGILFTVLVYCYYYKKVRRKNVSYSIAKDDFVDLSNKGIKNIRFEDNVLQNHEDSDEQKPLYQSLKTKNESGDILSKQTSIEEKAIVTINKNSVVVDLHPCVTDEDRKENENTTCDYTNDVIEITTKEKETSNSMSDDKQSFSSKEFLPKLPPKKKNLQGETLMSPQSCCNTNNSNNRVIQTESLINNLESLNFPLSNSNSFNKIPPARPRMGVSRYKSFSDNRSPKIKPKIPPKPAMRSKSFQVRPTFLTSDLYPLSETKFHQN